MLESAPALARYRLCRLLHPRLQLGVTLSPRSSVLPQITCIMPRDKAGRRTVAAAPGPHFPAIRRTRTSSL